MDKQVDGPLLPFKVGQLAESRSFVSGYRSAWFRCKIKDISRKKGNMDYALEFYDFPDDKIKSTRIYQIPPQIGRKRATKITKMLMLRPQYPPIYRESEVAQANTISGVTVVITGVWKVGDLVDWWTDGCYWFGRVTQILGDDKLQIELPPPPIGEGTSYEVLCKDLRPSLDWSPEHGWSVLTSQEGEENYHPCARLIKPLDQAGLPIVMVNGGKKIVEATDGSKLDASFPSPVSANALPPVDKSEHSIGKEPTRRPLTIATPKEETQSPRIIAAAGLPIVMVNGGKKIVEATDGSKLDASFPSPVSANALPPVDKSEHSIGKEPTRQPLSIATPKEETHSPRPNTDSEMGDGAVGQTGLSQRSGNIEAAGNSSGKDQYYSSGSAKKIRTGGNICLNSMRSDTIEAPIMDLEELVNKVKWLKGILESGVPLPNAGRSPWKFVEHHGSSTPE